MKKAIDIVRENKKKFDTYNNYIVEGTEIIKAVDGRLHKVRATLHFFTDDSGNLKRILRE